jgi:hypothetical protein
MLTYIKDWKLGVRREQQAIDSLELEEAFKDLYLDEEEGSGGTGGASAT